MNETPKQEFEFDVKLREPDNRLFETVERLAQRLGVSPLEPGEFAAIHFDHPDGRRYSFEALWMGMLDRMDEMAAQLETKSGATSTPETT